MLQFDEYKVKLNNLLPQLDDLEKALNLESAAREVDFLEAQSAADGFWDNPENSQKVLQRTKQLKDKAEIIRKAFFGPVTPQVPASILQMHPNFVLVADEDALSLV